MRRLIGLAALLSAAATPALADTYTVSDMMANGQQAQTLGTSRIDISTSSTASWASTAVGINKVYSSANGQPTGNSYVSSIWGETFTADAAATGPVRIRFTVGIDGSAAGINADTSFNYYLKAIRGTADGFVTADGNANGQVFRDVSIDQQLANGTTRSVSLDGFNYVTSFPATGLPSHIDDHRDAGGYFESYGGATPAVKQRFFSDHVERSINGGAFQKVAGSNGSAFQSIADNFMVADSDSLCSLGGSCGNGLFGTPASQRELSLDFLVNPGDSFFVTGALMVQGLTSGTIDFGATAKLTQVSAFSDADPSQAVNLLSDSGGIVANAGSPFAAAAVPEPASWAMMLLGFGAVGSALRCRSSAARLSI